ncbi:MAG: hypothetical protein ACYDCO_15215 [Armatimonadota bacterium]
MRFPAVYAIVVGLLMLGQWAFFLATGQVPELRTRPVEFAFHLAAEVVTALGLLVAGIGALRRAAWGRPLLLATLGMLIYTVIASPGYFAAQRAWPLVGMFAVLLVLAVMGIILLVRDQRS